MENMKNIQRQDVSIGCDPEMFITSSKGDILGSEHLLPEGGMSAGDRDDSKIVRDGVQIELNPEANECRAYLGNEVHRCFRDLNEELKNSDMKPDFSPVVEVSKRELDRLSEKSREFGCAPSFNSHTKSTTKVGELDGSTYRTRCAGGHIHLGGGYGALSKPEILVPILDILVGNTAVLLDRDAGQKERRKYYGQAGEYRLPPHGLEYRTLSNFWLRAYPLASFMWGMSRLSVGIAEMGEAYYTKLFELVDMADIVKAINENDFDLAYKNFEKIVPFIIAATPVTGMPSEDFQLTGQALPYFRYFVHKGMNHWFKHDIMEHWVHLPDGHECGWETFMYDKVKKEYDKLSKAHQGLFTCSCQRCRDKVRKVESV